MAIEMEKGSVSIDAQNIMPVIKRWLYSDIQHGLCTHVLILV